MTRQSRMPGIVNTFYGSYPARDREAIEAVVDEDFRFTSPLDHKIGRQTYFERCWPNGEAMESIDIERLTVDGDNAFVTYEARMKDGRRFKNTEVLTVRNGKVAAVEVYFGWSIHRPASYGNPAPFAKR